MHDEAEEVCRCAAGLITNTDVLRQTEGIMNRVVLTELSQWLCEAHKIEHEQSKEGESRDSRT